MPPKGRWYPMGHPLEIVTNSAEVLALAANLWGEFPPLSDAWPVELRIEVSPGRAPAGPPAIARHRQCLIRIEQGPENVAIADLNTGVGVIRITTDIARNRPWFAYHFLEPVAYVLLGVRHFTMIHAACVALHRSAALLCGAAGAGKTCLAYACARRGWSFVSGDATHLVRNAPEPTVIGRPFSIRFRSSAKEIFPELGGYRTRVRPNGKCDLELDPRQLRLPIAVRARAGLIVFLNRAPGARQAEIEPVSVKDAKDLLSEWICLGGARVRSEQRQALLPLLRKPVIRLTYSDVFAAEKLLRSEIGNQSVSAAANGSRTQKQAPRCAPFSTHRSPP